MGRKARRKAERRARRIGGLLQHKQKGGELSDVEAVECFGKFTAEDKARGRGLFESWASSLPEREREELLDIEAIERCEKGICPRCGGHLDSMLGTIVKIEDFEIEKDYGAGYYAVRDPP